MTSPIETNNVVERLREEARQEEAAHKMLADAKTARQTDRADAWTDAGYAWTTAEQTTRWQAADLIQSLSDRIDVLEGENAKLREALWNARQQAKRRGKDILQDEANAVLPHFRRKWEPLRTVAKRTGQYSAQQLASRARDLCKRGLVEQRWNDGVMRISEWRSTGGRRVPITISGQMPLASLTQGGKTNG